MFGHSFYFGTTRRYIILFGKLFDDIIITRDDADGNIIDSIKVPIVYAPKDKMLARIKQDPDLDRETAISLPRMSFEYKGYVYDDDRKLNTLGWVARKDDESANRFARQYNPVPINLPFKLYIYVKNAEDGTKIVEQIVPFFKPEWTAKVNLIPELDIAFNTPIVMGDCTPEDIYDGAFTQRRALVWTIDFTIKGFLFGPIKKVPIIKYANTQYRTGEPGDASEPISITTVTPGLLANGSPTSNAAASISPLLIEVDDDWNYAITQSGLIITE